MDRRDRRSRGHARGVAHDRVSPEDSLEVTPSRMMVLTPGPGVADRVARESDLEAIAALPDGTFLMGEEGHVRDGEVWQPAILHVTRDGVVISVTPYPPKFSITDDPAPRAARQPGLRKPDASRRAAA